MTKKLHTVN